MMAPRKNIVLCGFMGSGKSTVGKLLSRRLDMEFIDMDDYIEQQQGMEIREIFASMGEAAFRRMETEAAEKLSSTGGHVIAAGGGTLLSTQNVEILRRNGIIVLLDAPLDALQQRLKRDRTRPLLQKPDREKVIRELHAQRMPLYRAACTLSVNAGQPPAQVAEDIAAAVADSIQAQA